MSSLWASSTTPAMMAGLEGQLGDAGGDGPFSWAAAVARDEAERHPAEALERLAGLGVARLHVPRSLGGELDSFEQPLALARTLSRRDPALALSAGMGVWSHLAWMAGDEPQRARVRERILGGDVPCLAVSEPDHGADLLAGEAAAREAPAGWVLDGVKWPIGAAGHAALAFVLARTEAERGPRELSWLLVDGEALRSAVRLPRAATLGMRSADLGGLAFRGTLVPHDALLGPRGAGLELALLLFQITRPLSTGLALGAADSALRIAAAFAAGRRLYRASAADLPGVEDALVGAFADLLAAEAVARTAVRGLHTHPEEASVASAVAKVMAPALTGRALRAAADVLGARFYLRRGVASGVFQKLLRDQLVVGLFDGSSGVCLQAIAAQLPLLLGAPPRGPVPGDGPRFALGRELPAFDAKRLALGSRGEDSVLRGLAHREIPASLAAARDDVLAALPELGAQLAGLRARGPAAARSPLPFHLAQRYATLHAAAACLSLARDAIEGLPGDWALLAVRRLLAPDFPLREQVPEGAFLAVRGALFECVAAPRALSLGAEPLFDAPIHDAPP